MNKNLDKKPRVQVQDNESIQHWCNHFECSESELFYCISKVGTSIASIESYMYMNRSILEAWVSKQLIVK